MNALNGDKDIQIDTRRMRRLRTGLADLLGHPVTQAEVSRGAGVKRSIIGYMENVPTRGYSFETVVKVAKYYRTLYRDPRITSDSLVLGYERSLLLGDEDEARANIVLAIAERIYSLPQEQLDAVARLVDSMVAKHT